MNTYVCTLTLPDGNKIVATARAKSVDEEVDIEWSGARDRLGQAVLGKHAVGFLCWYMQARAKQFGGAIRVAQRRWFNDRAVAVRQQDELTEGKRGHDKIYSCHSTRDP